MIAAAVALKVEVPETVNAPLSVMAPVLSTDRLPVIVEAPKFTAPVALTDTVAPVSNSAPVNEFDVVVRLMFLPVATIDVAPPIFNVPVFVTAPEETTSRNEVRVLAPSTVPVVAALVIPAHDPVSDRAPVNFEFKSINEIKPHDPVDPDVRVVVPPTVQLLNPVSRIPADDPSDVTTRFPVATRVSIHTWPVPDTDTFVPDSVR